MAKRVSVVLNEDVLSLGKDGDLVEVAPGYARNFLLPQGKAVPVTPAVCVRWSTAGPRSSSARLL